MAQKTTVPRLVRQGAGNPAADDALDDKRMARYLAQEWADDVAHSCGLGWFMRGTGGLWDCDAPGVQVRNRIRRVLTDASALAKRTVKTRGVARELSDELNVEVDEWNSGNVLALVQLGFVERSEVVPLLGPPGTGKSHLATALGFEAVRAGKSLYFATLAEIIASLLKAQREGELSARLRFLARPALLIVDEVGYLPLEPGGANLFFPLVNARYEKGALILTSNRGFRDGDDIFGGNVLAAALLDRLLHHAIVIEIEGSSYRLREHAHLMPQALNTTPRTPAPRRRKSRSNSPQVTTSLNG